MRKSFTVAALAVLLSLAAPSVYAGSKWNAGEWFHKQKKSTTVTGQVESVEGRKVMFKTSDGQVLELTGRKAEQIAQKRGATIRVFGNVRKPDAHYPSGAIDVRNYRVLEEAQPVSQEPASEPFAVEPPPEPMPEPEPAVVEPEPEPLPEPEPIVESSPLPGEIEEPAGIGHVTEYTVVKGDTLAKISQKVYGTTKKWKKIADANNITNPKKLKVGMTLHIPQ